MMLALNFVFLFVLAISCCVLEFTKYVKIRRCLLIFFMVYGMSCLVGIYSHGRINCFEYRYSLHLIKGLLQQSESKIVIEAIDIHDNEYRRSNSDFFALYVLRKHLSSKNQLDVGFASETVPD